MDQFVVPKKTPSSQKSETEDYERYEHYEHSLRTPTNSGEASPQSSDTPRQQRFGSDALPSFFDYKIPEELLNAFQSRDYPDPEDELENDDQMSGDYDESLGILTPSQMRDFTLCPDLQTSCSDIRALDFPSSESFDDINDLPEDEQVHDVSVKYLPESSLSAKRVLEVAKQNGVGSFAKKEIEESMVSSTDKFLFSISQKNFGDFDLESHFLSSGSENAKPGESGTTKLNNLSSINVFGANGVAAKKLPEKLNLGLETYSTTCTKESVLTTSAMCPTSPDVSYAHLAADAPMVLKGPDENGRNLSDSNKIALRNFSESDMSRKNYDTDSSRDSLLQAESENNSALKEKLTVSWEDCISPNSNDCCPFTPVERPESVYTVASSDTGFQEDAEMVTSIDSTEGNKRFSTTSRDSCIVTEELDGYKIAESNSTSGYSTGLSDSCCNDRPEDDVSSKRLTDEEIQDSVGPCDSEDAFSFHENSLSKDTVETVTALCHDSTSDALCETMVEDATLTEIHDLLLSPEDNQKVIAEDKENREEAPVPEDASPLKTVDKATSSAKSTPEKRLNSYNKTRSEVVQRTPAAANNKLSGKTSRICDDSERPKKQQQQQLVATAKSPKRNVMSKIKAMIEKTASKKSDEACPAVQQQKRVSSTPKKSRWEAVTSKIAASLAEEKTKPKAKREVRSRVDTNLTLARQQVALCKSPKLDSRSMSPVSVSSRRPLSERNSAPNSVKDGRASTRSSKQESKSPRPKACLTSRSASPVAASESSTASLSLASHHSRSKIATWKGSSSTVASSVPPATVTVKRQSAVAPPPTKPPLQTARSQRMVTKKSAGSHQPRITLQVPGSASVRSLSPAARNRNKIEQPSSRVGAKGGGGPVRPPAWLSKAELGAEIQRLGTLCEARTKELNRLKMETRHVTAGFDAFAALFKYTVEELNALSVPALSEDLSKTLRQLELAKQDIAYYEREAEEIKSHHCQELNDLSNRLFEVYQSEVAELNVKHQEEINRLKNDHQKQMEHLQSSYDASSSESKACYEKMVAGLEQEIVNQREELQQLHDREVRDLEQRQAEGERLLREHLDQLQGKCAELAQRSAAMEEALRRDTDSKLQWVTSAKLDLEKEVESLKAVLEMKNKELHALRVHSLEAEKQLEELPLAREKIKMLQARAEDLEALMAEKTRAERQLVTENQAMRDTFEKESKVNRRLSMENEELLWRLRQAENSLLSGSFSAAEGAVPVFPEVEEEEGGATSPTKSPQSQTILSRSVFFTFADRDEGCPSSPRSHQYKKITPAFAAGYKTSPARSKSHSEPPQPPTSSTPRKVAKQVSKAAKRQRQRSGGSDAEQRMASSCEHPSRLGDSVPLSSSAEHSMASSCDSATLEHQNRLIEEHRGHIAHSLEVLRSAAADDLSKKWCSDEVGISAVPRPDDSEMSRSAEFADPKTYYHMTFPVMPRESSDAEDKNSSGHSPSKDSTHSMSENDICSASTAPLRVESGVQRKADDKVDADRWRTI